jgi:hypothetical protein
MTSRRICNGNELEPVRTQLVHPVISKLVVVRRLVQRDPFPGLDFDPQRVCPAPVPFARSSETVVGHYEQSDPVRVVVSSGGIVRAHSCRNLSARQLREHLGGRLPLSRAKLCQRRKRELGLQDRDALALG